MKKKIITIVLLILVVFPLTGCAKILKRSDNKVVKNPETGQSLISNVLCQPNEKAILSIYDENNINYQSLPRCSNFTVSSGGYEGVWNSIFVKPLAFIIIKIGTLVNSYGLSLILITFLIRLILYPFTKKTAMQSELMQKAKPEIDRLEQKYKNQQSQEAMMQKSKEMSLIYKKYNINPLSSCLFAFIQIPLFFAFYEAIQRLPVIFENTFLGIFQMGTTPLVAFSKGQWYYAILIILIVLATYFSFKLNGTNGNDAQAKQMQMMSKIMIVFITIASFSLATGIAIYWITNSTCTVIQNLIVKRSKTV